MRIFRDKKREEFLEGEIRDLVTALEKVKGERDKLSFSLFDSEKKLREADALFLKADKSIGDVLKLCKEKDVEIVQLQAYKADNLTLISRIAQLQDELSASRTQYTMKCGDFEALNKVAQTLRKAWQKAIVAKLKKRKSAKKKRK